VQLLRAQARVAADRVAPVGIAAVDHDVASLERFAELLQDLVHRRPGRHVEEHRARRGELVAERFEVLNLGEARGHQVLGRAAAARADHLDALLERLVRQAAAHAAQADHAELIHFLLRDVLRFSSGTAFAR
jgi:hypothetical protein